MTVKPNVFLVGAAKSGTTALADALSQHPEVFVSPLKEPYCLCRNPEITEQQYFDLFRKAGAHPVRVDATTGYLYDDTSPALIAACAPDARIVAILRNPIDQVFSFWQFMKASGTEDRSFWEAFDAPETSQSRAGRAENYLYRRRALYAGQIARYQEVFEPAQLHIMIYDDYRQKPDAALRDLFAFLQVDPDHPIENRRLNEARETRSAVADRLIKRRYPLLRRLLPPVLRDRIRSTIKRSNQRRIDPAAQAEAPRLSAEERIRLWHIFAEDVARLASMLERPDLIDLWRPEGG